LKVLKTNIVIDAMKLAPGKMGELEQFMLQCVRAERDGIVADISTPSSSILKVVSYYFQRE
jgi:hypothetical protein